MCGEKENLPVHSGTFEVDCAKRSGCGSIYAYRKERVKSSPSSHGETLDLAADLITEDLISLVTQLIQQVLSFFFLIQKIKSKLAGSIDLLTPVR